MTEKKKTYTSPAVESEQIDLPAAWACTYQGTATTGACFDTLSSLPGSAIFSGGGIGC